MYIYNKYHETTNVNLTSLGHFLVKFIKHKTELSIKNKKEDRNQIIDSAKPDIILGTETWLDKDTSSHEFFPSELFNVYRSDRKPNKNNQSYGGVLIAINKEFISTEINMSGSKNLLIGAYYRPPSDKETSLQQLELSLSRTR